MSGSEDLSIWLDSWLSQLASGSEASWEWDFHIVDEPGDVDSRDTHWHRAHWRETAPASRVAVLDLLLDAYPQGLTTMQLIGEVGPKVQARIGELVLDGWHIDSSQQGADGTAIYRLISTVQGQPPMDPGKAPRDSAGRWYRLPDGTLHVECLRPRRGPDTDTWDQDQAERDVIEVRRALSGTVED